MKKLIGLLALALLIGSVIPMVEAKTNTEIWNQRLISHIHYNSNRLRNFCAKSETISEGYTSKVCKSAMNKECIEQLSDTWDFICSEYETEGSIRNYNYIAVFDGMRAYLKRHNLPLLKNKRDEAIVTIETTTTILQEETNIPGGNGKKKNRKMIVT